MKMFITISVEDSIQTLLEAISRPLLPGKGSGLVFITDKVGSLVGSVADSDIRRFISTTGRLPKTVSEVMRANPISLDSEVWRSLGWFAFAEQMDARGWKSFLPIDYLPITNNGKVEDVIDLAQHQEQIASIRDLQVVIGLGYVGLTLALVLASANLRVTGIDSSELVLNQLDQGVPTIMEPGINRILNQTIHRSLNFCNSLSSIRRTPGVAINFFVCVGTPKLEGSDQIDTSQIFEVVEEIVKVIQFGDSVIMRSTVQVGTGRKMCEYISVRTKLLPGEGFFFISAPERTVEGDAIRELQTIPQLLAGATTSCLIKAKAVFANICNTILPMTSLEACEMAKISTNAYRDYIFAFSNYLSLLCRNEGIDVDEVINSSNFGYDRSSIPRPSPGVGGPCLTKDSYMMSVIQDDSPSKFSPVVTSRLFNESVPRQIISFLKTKIGSLSQLTAMAIGLAFKGNPEVRDLRNSTSLEISQLLSTEVHELYLADAISDLSTIKFGTTLHFPQMLDRSPTLFLLLNNHQRNLEILFWYLTQTQEKEVWIFDPWRLIDQSNIPIEVKSELNVLTMSTLFRFKSHGC